MYPISKPEDLLNAVLARNTVLQAVVPAVASPTEAPPELDVVDFLAQSARNVFARMFNIRLSPVHTRQSGYPQTRHALTGLITIHGCLKAEIAINLSETLALAITTAMSGTRPNSVDSDVIDVIGELANMIGGNAKERLKKECLQIGLPTVIFGQTHQLHFEEDGEVAFACFTCDEGAFQIEVSLRDPY
ncbi:chemotaxis protein CheX [Aureliella helgolandensis]|uniref:Chemotaxis phosphatase CheX-like domain-containing protein n=1 Tax=Aureliella helgolandensis TaxID=2527968 RepID=A0A518G5Y6_9BACT|nr:chemotaxis protein CheX [Aureliella helgolandensis]QDV23995.1 hypothetical protein Q31a_23080 [Aureliella helgolandensis]